MGPAARAREEADERRPIPQWPRPSSERIGRKEEEMPDSVYKIIELVGTSTVSWEEAAKSAVELAAKSLRDLRIAEIAELDMQIDKGKVVSYRAKVKVSFKYEGK
jgi:flavin-binding protein dodecin